MAIVQASLQEEVLTRSERAVIRGIYRASQLSEAKLLLEKTLSNVSTSNGAIASAKISSDVLNVQIKSLMEYLSDAVLTALVATKVPAKASPKSTPSKETLNV